MPSLLAVLLLLSCGGENASLDAGTGIDAGPPTGMDAGRRADASTDAAPLPDAGDSIDGGSLADGSRPVDAGNASGDAGPFEPGPEPTAVLHPQPGEVTIIQLHLSGVFQLGEAAVLVGPDGTIVLMDVGNSRHDAEVRAMVRALNTSWVTPENGFPRTRGEFEVDWIVLSHFHADHIGGFENLMTGAEAIEVTHGVVHRGYVDLGGGVTERDYREVCDLLSGPLVAADIPLCVAGTRAPCDFGDFSGSYPAVDCDGLLTGDLNESLDDVAGAPSFIDLGQGARMVFVAANGFASDGSAATSITPFGTDANSQENARSIVTVLEYGEFRYHWGGDLTGSGDSDEPDVESHLVSVSGPHFYGDLGSDVVHAHHHVRRSSSNMNFVNALLPNDGLSRNVIGGINGGHIGSPHGEVLARFGDEERLGEGRIWVTMSATGGDSHSTLIDADADVILQTLSGGRGYRVQAARSTPESSAFVSVR